MSILRIVRLLPPLALAVLVTPALSADPSIPEIPRFHQVTAQLFRGGQPSVLAWPKLAALGVTTVIDLRREVEHSTAAEARAVEAAGMHYVNFPMDGFDTPTAAQMGKVLRLVDSGDTVFVHCKLGVDRTGTVVAAYRIAREHWANRQALDEAEALGMNWYSRGEKRFILGYKPLGDAPADGAPMDSASTPVLVPGAP